MRYALDIPASLRDEIVETVPDVSYADGALYIEAMTA